MEPERTCSSKAGNTRSYRKWLCSDVKEGKAYGESETEIFSVKRRTQNVKRRWDRFNKKPRSKRKRSTEFWSAWQNKVSENIKTTVELYHVKNSKSTSSERQGLEEKVRKQRLQKQGLADQLVELEEGEIPPSPSPANYFDSTTSDKNDLETEIHGETERQTVLHTLKDLEVEIPTHSHYTNDSCQIGSKEGKISMNSKNGGVLDDLMDMEDGKILASPHNQMLTDKLKEGRDLEEQLKTSNEIVQLRKETKRAVTMGDGRNFQTGIREKSVGTSQLTSRDIEEQLKTNDEIVQLGKETERPVMTVDDRDCRTGITEQSLGTSQPMSRAMDEQLKTHNVILHLGKETERPVTTSNGLCFSDSEFKVDKIQHTDMTATCSRSPKVPAHVSDVVPDKKKLSTSTVGTVIVVESDTDSDVVELTGQRSVTSLNVKNNEDNSSFNGPQHGTRSTSVGKQSPAQNDQIFDSVARPSEDPHSPLDKVAMVDQPAKCSGETIPACNRQNTEVKSYSHALEGLTDVENQITHKNKKKIDSIFKSSETFQHSFHEVIVVDQPAECSTEALSIQEQPVPFEVANLPRSQDRGAVTPACTESHLQFTVPPDVSAIESISVAVNQPPVSSVSFFSQHGLLNTPVSTGIQCPQSVGRHTSSPEAQASIHPLSEEVVQFSIPSLIDLQLPQVRSVQMIENDLHFFQGAGSRTNVQDFRSMTTGLASMTDLLFHANLLIPGRTQLPCYDPLQMEMDRLKKHYEQDLKMHEDMILHMKSKRDEDIEEVLKKYDILFQDAEAALQHKTMDFKAKFQKVFLNKLLANAVMLQHNNHREALTPDTRQAATDFVNQSVQNPTQMSADRLDQHPPVTVPSTPEINQPSPVLARPCSGGGPMDYCTALYQNGHGIRAVAPHLGASLSQSSMPSLHFPVHNNVEFMQHLPR